MISDIHYTLHGAAAFLDLEEPKLFLLLGQLMEELKPFP